MSELVLLILVIAVAAIALIGVSAALLVGRRRGRTAPPPSVP